MARGSGPRLSRDVLLDIELSAICSRHRYTSDPGPVIDELQRRAGKRTDILVRVAGTWAGFYDDPYTHTLAAALLTLDGAEEWVDIGQRRRSATSHKTP
jgi:hypothetical protein